MPYKCLYTSSNNCSSHPLIRGVDMPSNTCVRLCQVPCANVISSVLSPSGPVNWKVIQCTLCICSPWFVYMYMYIVKKHKFVYTCTYVGFSPWVCMLMVLGPISEFGNHPWVLRLGSFELCTSSLLFLPASIACSRVHGLVRIRVNVCM